MGAFDRLGRGLALTLALVFCFLPWDAPAKKGAGRHLVGAVNLNTATPEQLCLLPGVGPKTAERIVEERRKRPFKRPEEVVRVKGIGRKFVRKHKNHLRVEGRTDLAWVEVERGKDPSP